MAESTEVEERVDFDEDNYMEEMDDDVEEQLDEDGVDDAGEADVEDEPEEEEDDLKSGADVKEQSLGADETKVFIETVEDEEKPSSSANQDDKEKHAELLAIPPYGSEVFIGGLPKDIVEEDLQDLCKSVGEIFEIRMVKDRDTGESKGYAFVAFKSKEVAQKAIEELHSKDFKVIVILFKLEIFFSKLFCTSFKLDGNTPTVTWADPKGTHEQSAAASQVKALYVKDIPKNTTTDQLREMFQRHGEVTKAVMPPGKAGKRDFGFIHYAERSTALKAVKDTQKYEIDGQLLEVVLAKPQTDKKSDGVHPYNTGLHSNHLPHSGFGGFGNLCGSLGAGYGVTPDFQQSVIYGRGPMPTGMQMVPMVLLDGRIGYVLQQPGMQMPQPRPRRVDKSNGLNGHPGRAGGSGSDDGNSGRRYRPY
ncbi:heterogeneous nuclear ribonucleoprotein Q [Tripterygium wilfordii]|uniref:Heterogeneous nuclear ribonucleoprotein Q n=1 Tax=Tripterygium wilfordii TaxID=458696 RepID=A0A7J7CDI7_TRIWF|nr:heterogeneous nuclear ribonucleoprotein Q [Tripterygium wilfordii]